MLRSSLLAALTILSSLALAETPQTHRALDWTGPWRWVHVDNVDADRVPAFEDARLGWKKALRPDGVLLGDGRPLFWCARGDSVQTYFTFFPFRSWADLDTRSEMAKHNAVVGETAVAAYDAGDASLVPPHCSQIWRRRDSADIAWPATSSLTELSAPVGRLERREVDWVRWDEFDQRGPKSRRPSSSRNIRWRAASTPILTVGSREIGCCCGWLRMRAPTSKRQACKTRWCGNWEGRRERNSPRRSRSLSRARFLGG